jgi:hypothetical protein
MMGGGLLWWLIVSILTVVPFWRILPRYGFPNVLALVALIPFGAIGLLWLIAFRDEIFGPGER